jgi:hypothetical protein
MAKEGQENGDRENQLYVNSSINDTVISFKSNDKDPTKIGYESSLQGFELPKRDDLTVNTTYNQILNLSHEKLETFDYIFIDESHALTNDISFRADTISELIYHLIEFVTQKPSAKTKIVFMSGTPNVEINVIRRIMEEYQIENLFQRINVDKKYHSSPTVKLIHLEPSNSNERRDEVVSQIQEYLKEDRKVCYLFNHKEKMDDMKRLIQTKLSKNIKVGLFYSGSTGECTQNILSGKFGDYDVVLTTDYFVNGININKDGLTDKEIKEGKTSTQKYALVLDLGNKYSRSHAMNAVQAINRFRNRLCECTVFFPKIFKPDEAYPKRKFRISKCIFKICKTYI